MILNKNKLIKIIIITIFNKLNNFPQFKITNLNIIFKKITM